jgi:S1-C subfamily serine protease
VNYKVLRDDFFVVHGTLDGRDYYTKFILDRGYAAGFTFAWDSRALPSGDRVAVLMSNSFFPADTGNAPSIAETQPAQPVINPPPEPQRPSSGGTSYGSGFFVTSDGLMVTNNHVVEKCTSITVGGSNPAVVTARDVGNDLALIRTSYPGTAAALRSASIGLGDVVYALGYPFAGTLDNGLNITNGLVSSLSGIQNDSRYVQITAAVQPGNSGGPLVDEFGNIAGVVSARLDDLNMLRTSGMLPQNVNFAIRSDFVMSFLRANSVEPTAIPSIAKQTAADIARAGRSFTAQIVCVERS